MTSEAPACEAVGVSLLLGEVLSDELRAHAEQCKKCRSAAELSRGLHGALGAGAKWTKGDVVLDQYEILEEIGRGGQAAVYKARDQETGLVVALKAVVNDKSAVEEVRLAVGINHPNVCRIHYTKAAGPFRIIVMEYVRGGSLHERLQREPILADEALRLFRRICEGVRAAHARDVLHLDLKPGNVLLRDSEEPVVCDFGLATISGAAPKGGTEGYMAPEQMRGDRVGPRTDVFALGVILEKLVPEPPAAIKRLIEAACTPNPDERIPTVSDLLARLERSQRRAPPRSWILVAVATLAAGGGLASVAASRRSNDADPTDNPERGKPGTAPAPVRGSRGDLEDAAPSQPSIVTRQAVEGDASAEGAAPAATVSRPSSRPLRAAAPAKANVPAASALPTAASAAGAVDHKPCCDALQELAKKYAQPNVLNVAGAVCNFAKVGYQADVKGMVDNNLSCRGIPQPCEPVPVPAACK